MHLSCNLRLLLLVLFSAMAVSACSSGSSGGFNDDDESSASKTFTVSGRIYASAGITVDSDINDVMQTPVSNNTSAQAQVISNLATVQGFASAEPTLGRVSDYPRTENFAYSSDELDYFRVSLHQNQTITLQVIDYAQDPTGQSYSGDLDLCLIEDDPAANTAICSDSEGQYEYLTAPADGEYLVLIQAYSGASKYILNLSAANPLAIKDKHSDFVANQVVLESRSNSVRQLASAASLNISSVKSVAGNGPQLLTLDRSASQSPGVASQNAATDPLAPLKQFNKNVWEKIQTLRDIKALNQQADVVYAEPNYIRHSLAVPSDPLYHYQWHYPAINLPAAWDLSTGADVVVAVLDTGVFMNQEDLSGQLTSDGYDFISDASSALDGNGIDSNPDDPGDGSVLGNSSWHGTHVAGTIAAAADNGKGGVGVAWNARVMPVRVLGSGGSGTSFDIIQAINYAAGLHNNSGTTPPRRADIINMSLGSASRSTAEQNAINAAVNAGVIVVAAAGNDATNDPFYPASYNNVISVSATDYRGNLSYYSNYGSNIDVAAPGGDGRMDLNHDNQPDAILSTYVSVNDNGVRQSTYGYLQGTSMASPHVAGVIALMKSAYPDLTYDDFMTLLSTCAITNKAANSSCSRDDRFGYGQIDAYRAVNEALRLSSSGNYEYPVALQSSPTALSFTQAADSLSFIISNSGGSNADVTVSDNAGWLSVSATDVDSSGLGTYIATVDRSGLSDGFYNATITLTSPLGSVAGTTTTNISVTMINGSVDTANDLAPQYVLLTIPDCEEEDSCTYTSTGTDANGNFVFRDIPQGRYNVIAGSDIDVDGFICASGETCGAYPTLGSMTTLNVSRNISGLSFEVSLQGGITATALEHKAVFIQQKQLSSEQR